LRISSHVTFSNAVVKAVLATTSTRFCHPSAIGGFSDGEIWFHWFDEDQGAEDLPSHFELHLSLGVSSVAEQAQKPKGGCRVRSDAAVASSIGPATTASVR
jgi:hypothetical protein